MCQIQILSVLTQAVQAYLYLVGGSLVWRIKYFVFSAGCWLLGNADLAGNIFNFFPWCAEWRVPVRERCSVIFKINLHKAYRRHNSYCGE